MAKATGFIIYEGPSVLDGEPIVVIATMHSGNVKTGDMVQTWIMRSDVEPHTASKLMLDGSVCGGCPHRQSLGGACYVTLHQGPLSVFRAYKRGKYSHDWNPSTFAGRMVRLGAYGDPAAVPADIWESVLDRAQGWTGYTHQLAHRNFNSKLLKWCMVSADTPKQASGSHRFGRRTFRVKTEGAPLLPGEIECPSAKGVSCADCGLCNGAHNEGPSIAIDVHGARASKYTAKYGKVNLIPALSLS